MVEFVIRQYSRSLQVDSVESLANAGGFSGAQLWKAKVRDNFFCIRRWPRSHPPKEHLQWIHSVLLHAVENGCEFIPAPILTDGLESIVAHEGHLWEVTPWMPGVADLAEDYSEVKVGAAFQTLARFHLAVEPENRSEKPSAGIQERLDVALRLNRELPEMSARLSTSPLDSQTANLCLAIIELARNRLALLPDLLKPVAGKPLPHQPCIRDIWHQHVLFQGDQVTGIVDFGAMRIETVALDFARLLASLPGQGRDGPDLHSIAIEAYAGLRSLSELERQTIVAAFNAASTLSGLTWVRWLVVEGRTFEDMNHVRGRLEQIVSQLRG